MLFRSRPRGEVARLSVAVILDNESTTSKNADGTVSRTTHPRKPEELQKIQALVGAAVGLDTSRGDQLTVENVPFEEPIVEPEPKPTLMQRVPPQVFEGLRIVAILLLGIFAFFMFVKPLMRRATAVTAAKATAALTTQLPRTIQDLEGELAAQLQAQSEKGPNKLPALTQKLSALASKEPEHAARLLRMWMTQDGR